MQDIPFNFLPMYDMSGLTDSEDLTDQLKKTRCERDKLREEVTGLKAELKGLDHVSRLESDVCHETCYNKQLLGTVGTKLTCTKNWVLYEQLPLNIIIAFT